MHKKGHNILSIERGKRWIYSRWMDKLYRCTESYIGIKVRQHSIALAGRARKEGREENLLSEYFFFYFLGPPSVWIQLSD